MGNQFSFVSTARNYDIPRISIGNSTVDPREIASTSQPTGSTAGQTSSLTLSAIAQSGMSQFLGLISVDGKNPWILDSEATNHLIGFSEHFVSYTPYAGNEKIWIADDSLALIVGKGQIVLLTISRELHYKATFLPESICFEDLSLGRTIDTVRHSRELYILDDDTSGSSISRTSLLSSYFSTSEHDFMFLFLHNHKPTQPFTLVHSDVWGPSKITTSSGKWWFITFIDDHTRLTWVYLITVSENDRSGVLLENVEEKDNGNDAEVRTETRHELVGCKWLFTLKYKADGTLDKNKTRSSRGGLHEPPPGLKPSLAEINQLKQRMGNEFEIKDLGNLKYFLGMEGCRLADTAIEFNCKPGNSDDQVLVDKEQYQCLVGKLIYLSHTCPDIFFVVSVVSQFMQAPYEEHMEAFKRIMRYLKTTHGKWLTFRKIDRKTIEAYTDSDWAGSIIGRKSTSGYCTFVWGNLVTWRSKKQSVVARSSVEAEYRAMSLGICEEIWLQKVLSDLHQECETLLNLFCDNKAAISIANNPIQHDRTKHVEIDRHFIKERLDNRAYAFRPFELTSC
ncbi:putative mitochondrial protein [Cucumis melo var. makuwa]|uniref:Mitochondrial protein n=1 Tax=Cucumis melo var. makuwa TaxID=1194695 RepID=A0A5A7V881_CUCMM|nr:putative mitochondrial protein [Cucumis melo var. makuwa]